jgi:hypothetical protein
MHYKYVKYSYSNHGFPYGWKQAFLVSLFCGVIGVFIDIDHLICVLFYDVPIIPQEHQYGCRLWHFCLLDVALFIGGFGITLGIGLFIYMVYYSISTIVRNHNSDIIY